MNSAKRRQPKAAVRIKGLVSRMNHIRDQMAAGIPEVEVEAFRDLVMGTIRQVDGICRSRKITPEQLPAPSYRAYQYLKSIDLRNLPLRTGQAPAPKKRLRITNIVATCNRFQTEFNRCVRRDGRAKKVSTSKKMRLWQADDAEVTRMAADLQGHVDAVLALAQDEGAHPADLPTRSRRAYQWLAFLSDPEALAQHLTTLRLAVALSNAPRSRQALPDSHRDAPLRLEFFTTSVLYRTRFRKNEIVSVVNEGFIGAPKSVLEKLICLALGVRDPEYQQAIKAYAMADAFEETLAAMALTTAQLSGDTRGRAYDLAKVFERVNAHYFDGQMERPQLTWNNTVTTRKMGHYHALTDTVMVSITLDDARVPEYVVDYVMYHELLHKKLGVHAVNGRRYAHTSQFRDAEQEFQRYDEAAAFLSNLDRTLSL